MGVRPIRGGVSRRSEQGGGLGATKGATGESPLLLSSIQKIAIEFLDARKLMVWTDFGFRSLRDQRGSTPNLCGRLDVIQPVSDEEHFVLLRFESAHRHFQLVRALQGILAGEADREEPSEPELPEDPFASLPTLHRNEREARISG